MMTSTTFATTLGNPGERTFSGVVAIKIGGLVATCSLWRRRHQWRRDLIRFSDHMLADIGLTRGEAEAEMAKPFWRA
ncbi:MAG: DUF1127 domain-containing protein [Rhodospirillaceae bacterium]|nr:DUF1127 domain-containing protein [Rhodospirillaceae bacterium]